MRAILLIPALLLVGPPLCAVPEFYASEAVFLKEVGEGQMDPQLELLLSHTLRGSRFGGASVKARFLF